MNETCKCIKWKKFQAHRQQRQQQQQIVKLIIMWEFRLAQCADLFGHTQNCHEILHKKSQSNFNYYTNRCQTIIPSWIHHKSQITIDRNCFIDFTWIWMLTFSTHCNYYTKTLKHCHTVPFNSFSEIIF